MVSFILSKDPVDRVGSIVTIHYSIAARLGQPQQRSSSSSFLSLPSELRWIVFCHLLVPSPVVTIKRVTYDIQPAILLTNKEIYEQASSVLYRNNDWALLHINTPFRTFLKGWQLEDDLQRYPIVPLAEKSFTREPCLELRICRMGAEVRDTAKRDLRRFMVSLDGLPRVCQILTAAENTPGLEIVAKFAKVKATTLDKFMDCLEEICGYGSVVVEGLDAAATQTAINKLMIPEKSTQQEILERVTRDEARINDHIAQGRYVQAMKACQDGMAYIEFVCESMGGRRLYPDFPGLPILLEFSNIALNHAWCCLEYGDPQSACQIMSLFLGSDRHTSLYRHTLASKCKGHLYYGLSLVAAGTDNAAAFSLFQALAVSDSYEKADKALSAMEARIALRESDEETIRIRQNLQNFVELRHREVQSLVVETVRLAKLLSRFLMSDEERKAFRIRTAAFLAGRVGYFPLSRIVFGHSD